MSGFPSDGIKSNNNSSLRPACADLTGRIYIFTLKSVTRYMPYLSETKMIYRLQNIISDQTESFVHIRTAHKKTGKIIRCLLPFASLLLNKRA